MSTRPTDAWRDRLIGGDTEVTRGLVGEWVYSVVVSHGPSPRMQLSIRNPQGASVRPEDAPNYVLAEIALVMTEATTSSIAANKRVIIA